jgi:hypothetical protein
MPEQVFTSPDVAQCRVRLGRPSVAVGTTPPPLEGRPTTSSADKLLFDGWNCDICITQFEPPISEKWFMTIRMEIESESN